MRRVSVAHDTIHTPSGYEPYMTEYGLTATKLGDEGPTDEDLADVDTFEIESIVRADRIGRDYKLWVKWKDHTHVTPRWRSELLRETTNPEILADIKRVVAEAKLRADITQGRLDDEEDVSTTLLMSHALMPLSFLGTRLMSKLKRTLRC